MVSDSTVNNDTIPGDSLTSGDTIVHSIPQEFKDYFLFQTGSWWIYQDSISGSIDTVTTDVWFFNIVTDSNGQYHNWETLWLDRRYENCGTQTPPPYCVDNHFVDTRKDAGKYYLRYYQSFSFGAAQEIRSVHLIWPFEGSYAGCTIEGLHASFMGFSNVVEATTESDFTHLCSYKNTRSHYAKNIGLIRFEIPSENVVKKLINYHIVQ